MYMSVIHLQSHGKNSINSEIYGFEKGPFASLSSIPSYFFWDSINRSLSINPI